MPYNFDSIAPTYDRLNHLLSFGRDYRWRHHALYHIIHKAQTQHILDVACGTGDMSLAMARCANPQTHIEAVDISRPMLQVMDEKIRRAHLDDRIHTQQADVTHLPFDDDTFDHVTVAFGVRNFQHPHHALQEIYRVLQVGGKVVILELSMPKNILFRPLYRLYFCHIVPFIGGLISGDKAAYRYLPASVQHFATPAKWCSTMRASGFHGVIAYSYTLGTCHLYVGRKLDPTDVHNQRQSPEVSRHNKAIFQHQHRHR